MSEATEAKQKSRGLQKTRQGLVSSTKMDKTVVVTVSTKVKHPTYGKFITRSKKYMAHDENNDCGEGDKVVIVETRPLSKNKRWRVQSIVERAA